MSKTLLIASNLAIFTAYHERQGDIFYPAVHELCRLAAIEQAAIALIKCKGRYHAEQNTKVLAEALGIELPRTDAQPPTKKTERDTLAANLAAEQTAPTAQDKADIVDDLADLLGCKWFKIYHQVATLLYEVKGKS